MWVFFVLFLLFFASIHSEVREVKEIQAWSEKGEAIAPPTSYLREREGGGKRERERERESTVVVLEIGRHELYMNRVKCFKTRSAFVSPVWTEDEPDAEL